MKRLLGDPPSVLVGDDQQHGYLNQNRHDSDCFHQPILVAIQDVIHDEHEMWALINHCPLQRDWASAVSPKGFFFCEVAAAMDFVMRGPGGLPITAGCWRHDLADYREQIERWCPRCGMCLPLEPRRDNEERDDISPSNLRVLDALGSPRVLRGEYVLFDAKRWKPPKDWKPLRYLR